MSAKDLVKLRYLYKGDWWNLQFRYISYPWVTYLFTGMTSEEVQALTEKLLIDSLARFSLRNLGKSPESLKGEAGQVENQI